MASWFEGEKRCAVCGLPSPQSELVSAGAWGASDLDGRTPEVVRSGFRWSVERCPHCGYCAPGIDEASRRAGLVVAAPAYQQLLAAASLPEPARRFLCSAMIAEKVDSWASKLVVDLCLQAAWACDDAGSAEAAADCRLQAAAALEALHKFGGQHHPRDRRADYVLLADLYRRAGRFEEAEGAALQAVPDKGFTLAGQLAKLELRLTLERDDRRHAQDEVVAGDEGGQAARDAARAEAFAVLESSPHGVRHGNLLRRVLAADPTLEREAVAAALWALLEEHPADIYSPARGLLRMTRFRDSTWRPQVPVPWEKDRAPVNAIPDKYRGTTVYAKVLVRLVEAAQDPEETVRFPELAEIMGITPKGQHMAKEVGHVLNEICEGEVNRGRPMLSALVVGSGGWPGAGFFECARTLGLLAPDDADERAFWEIELVAVREEWRG